MKLSYHNQNLLDTAMPILDKLQALTFDAAIAGGWCRDVLHDVDAKDLDICVYNFHSQDSAERHFLLLLMKALDEDGLEPSLIYGQHSDGTETCFSDHQVCFIIKTNANIDIVIYEDCHPNPHGPWANFKKGKPVRNPIDLCRMFDCNLNQYYWIPELGRPEFGGIVGYHPTNGVYMVRGLKERPQRIEKMALKAEELGYHFAYPME